MAKFTYHAYILNSLNPGVEGILISNIKIQHRTEDEYVSQYWSEEVPDRPISISHGGEKDNVIRKFHNG